MRSSSASISLVLIPENKLPTFLNGLRYDPARQALFRKVPSKMEEAIEIDLVKKNPTSVPR